jgi:hypothetical protein
VRFLRKWSLKLGIFSLSQVASSWALFLCLKEKRRVEMIYPRDFTVLYPRITYSGIAIKLFNHPCNKSLGGLEPPLQDEEKVGKTF